MAKNRLESNHTYPILTYKPNEIQINKQGKMRTDNVLKAAAG